MNGARHVELATQPPRQVELADRYAGLGGQAWVYADTQQTLAVKLYHRPTDEAERRLQAMLRLHTEDEFRLNDQARHPVLAWPSAAVKEPANGHVIGYAMRWIGPPEHVPLGAFLNTNTRLERFPRPVSWRFVLGVARNVCGLVSILHERGLVVGDVSHANLVVHLSGFVTFLDCDSMPFTDPTSGEQFRCPVLTADYAAPELHRDPMLPRTRATDNFSLAVLVCRLLLMGDHPFMGTPRAANDTDEGGISQNIERGCSYLVDAGAVTLPEGTIDLNVLPPDALRLAKLAFGPGHEHPELRPGAQEWWVALNEADQHLAECGVNPLHKYSSHLAGCPWCARITPGHPDLFPTPLGRGRAKAVWFLITALLLLAVVVAIAIASQ